MIKHVKTERAARGSKGEGGRSSSDLYLFIFDKINRLKHCMTSATQTFITFNFQMQPKDGSDYDISTSFLSERNERTVNPCGYRSSVAGVMSYIKNRHPPTEAETWVNSARLTTRNCVHGFAAHAANREKSFHVLNDFLSCISISIHALWCNFLVHVN